MASIARVFRSECDFNEWLCHETYVFASENSSSVDKFRTLLCTRDDAIESGIKKKKKKRRRFEKGYVLFRIDLLKVWKRGTSCDSFWIIFGFEHRKLPCKFAHFKYAIFHDSFWIFFFFRIVFFWISLCRGGFLLFKLKKKKIYMFNRTSYNRIWKVKKEMSILLSLVVDQLKSDVFRLNNFCQHKNAPIELGNMLHNVVLL